jgi:hypothetical protein
MFYIFVVNILCVSIEHVLFFLLNLGKYQVYSYEISREMFPAYSTDLCREYEERPFLLNFLLKPVFNCNDPERESEREREREREVLIRNYPEQDHP